MLDINLIREKPEIVREALVKRQMDPAPVDAILGIDSRRRAVQAEVETLKAQRNTVSKEISQMKDQAARQGKINSMRLLGDQISQLDEQFKQLDEELLAIIHTIPNIPDAAVPLGKDDHDNPVIKTWGEPKKFEFTPKAHWDLGPELGIINFEQGIKLTGSTVLCAERRRCPAAARSHCLDAGSAYTPGLH